MYTDCTLITGWAWGYSGKGQDAVDWNRKLPVRMMFLAMCLSFLCCFCGACARSCRRNFSRYLLEKRTVFISWIFPFLFIFVSPIIYILIITLITVPIIDPLLSQCSCSQSVSYLISCGAPGIHWNGALWCKWIISHVDQTCCLVKETDSRGCPQL